MSKTVPNSIWQKFVSRMSSVDRIIEKNPNLLVSVSGGPDSIFLAYLLYRYSIKRKLNLTIVYIDHKVRNKDEIKKDISVIKKFTEKFGLKVIIEKLSESNKKDENTLREKRYNKLLDLSRKTKCYLVALGHTKDDVVETFMFNLLRGSGLEGLAGMPFLREIKEDTGIFLFRPIIDISKEEIIQVLKNNKISYSIDTTNLKTDYTRNKIRNILIPLMNKIQNNFQTNIIKTIQIINGVVNEIKKIVDSALKKSLIIKGDNKLEIDFKKIIIYNKPILEQIILKILKIIAKRKKLIIKSGYNAQVNNIVNFLVSNQKTFIVNKEIILKKIKNKIILELK